MVMDVKLCFLRGRYSQYRLAALRSGNRAKQVCLEKKRRLNVKAFAMRGNAGGRLASHCLSFHIN
jgi:hypothetical protein